MNGYTDILKYTLEIITYTNLAFVAGGFLIFLLFRLLHHFFGQKMFDTTWLKRLSELGLVCIAIAVAEYALLAVPRVIDIQKQSFVTVENAEFYVDDTENGSEIFYGTAKVVTPDGKAPDVLGINFFDLAPLHLDEISPFDKDIPRYHGTAVYARHSRQMIRFVTEDGQDLLKLPEE